MITPMPYAIGSTCWPGLSKLIEECGEAIVAASAVLEAGASPSAAQWSALDEEVADVLAAIDFVAEANGRPPELVDREAVGVELELVALISSAGSLLQVAGKLIAVRGALEHFDGSDLGRRLSNSMGALVAAASAVLEVAYRPAEVIERRRDEKRRLFRSWHAEQAVVASLVASGPLEAVKQRIYDVLVAEAGAPDDELCRLSLAAHWPRTREHRFGGFLGSGGKLRYDRQRVYVDCYPEDETDERRDLIGRVNDLLAPLGAELQRAMANPSGA